MTSKLSQFLLINKLVIGAITLAKYQLASLRSNSVNL